MWGVCGIVSKAGSRGGGMGGMVVLPDGPHPLLLHASPCIPRGTRLGWLQQRGANAGGVT